MKITEITTEEYRWPRRTPITNGLHTYTHVEFALVRIKTDQGVEGIGLGSGGDIWRATINELAPLLVGQDPNNTERLWAKMWVPKLIGRRGLTRSAFSGQASPVIPSLIASPLPSASQSRRGNIAAAVAAACASTAG